MTAVKAADVVAPGESAGVLQLSSPVYDAKWIDHTHILIAAGGGGQRFGMANVLVLLRIDTTGGKAVKLSAGQAPPAADRPAAPGGGDGRSNNNSKSDGEQLWEFVAALDLGGDVAWCLSRFLPYERPSASSSSTSSQSRGAAAVEAWPVLEEADVPPGLAGFAVVSSISCFYLVGVVSEAPDGSSSSGAAAAAAAVPPTGLLRLARVEVPSDPKNPDKKPVALVHNVVAVAHDEAGVLLYSLPDLLRAGREPQPGRAPAPLAHWPLPARANDLAANRLRVVYAGPARGRRRQTQTPGASPAGGDPPHARRITALPLSHVVLVAIAQDKAMHVATFRLRQRFAGTDERAEGVQASDAPAPLYSVVPHASVSGAYCGLPFDLTRNSLRLVRLFGLEDLPDAAAEGAALQQLTRLTVARAQHLQTTSEASSAPPPAPQPELMGRILLLAYDFHTGRTFVVPLNVGALLEPAPESSSSRASAAASPARPPQAAHTPARPSAGGSDDPNHSRAGRLRLLVTPAAAPSPLLPDAITALTPAAAQPDMPRAPLQDGAAYGARVPTRWFVTSADGCIATVELGAAEASPPRKAEPAPPSLFRVTHQRPSAQPAVAQRFPALHQVAITSVAAAGRVVVTTDLAQTVRVSTLPPLLFPETGQEEGEGAGTASADPLCVFPDMLAGGGGGGGVSALLASRGAKAVLFLVLPLMLILLAILLS